MIEIRAATYDDLAGILANISDISLQEVEAFKKTPWDVTRTFHLCRKSMGCDVMLDDGKPLCMFGAIRPKEKTKKVKEMKHFANECATWFFASKEYFEKLRYLKESAKYMKQAAKRHSHIQFRSATASQHPRVDKWFRLLGFELEQDLDPVRVYRYVGN